MNHHLIFAPDGNRRWAKENQASFQQAYDIGARKASDVVTWCFQEDMIDELSLWILHEYNLERKAEHIKPLTKAVMDCIAYVSENPIMEEKQLQRRIVGELDSFFSKYEGHRDELDRLLERTREHKGKVVNVLVSYNGSKELIRAAKRCIDDAVSPTLENMSVRWSISPVTLLFRTGQPSGFNRLSDYFPGVEQARLISTPEYPNNLTKGMLQSVIRSYINLKDSYDRL
jgi:undecaprenyl diphosphate synthase